MKPDWKDAPEWARWVAKDSDNRWHWFELKPKYCNGVWEEGSHKGRIAVVGHVLSHESLQERPK